MPTPSAKTEAAPRLSTLASQGRVTAIVPARNEELVIETCVKSLAQQAEIAEIIVVDDQSTDRTADTVRRLLPQIANLRLLQAPEIPAAWLGKNHALWEGAKHASSPWLLFTDADAKLLDGAVAR